MCELDPQQRHLHVYLTLGTEQRCVHSGAWQRCETAHNALLLPRGKLTKPHAVKRYLA